MIEIRLGGARQAFDGPLDLLLALARRGGYPLDQIPIAQISREFLACLQAMRGDFQDERGAGYLFADALAEFAEAASWLVLLKSRALLPSEPDEGQAELPERELERVLLGHAALREAAGLLRERLEAAGLTGPPHLGARSPMPESTKPTGREPAPTASSQPQPTIADAVQSARRALDAIRARPSPDLYRLEDALARLETALAPLPAGKAVPTGPWFAARPAPEARAALLLALLELARTGRILLHQPADFGPVSLKRIGD